MVAVTGLNQLFFVALGVRLLHARSPTKGQVCWQAAGLAYRQAFAQLPWALTETPLDLRQRVSEPVNSAQYHPLKRWRDSDRLAFNLLYFRLSVCRD